MNAKGEFFTMMDPKTMCLHFKNGKERKDREKQCYRGGNLYCESLGLCLSLGVSCE